MNKIFFYLFVIIIIIIGMITPLFIATYLMPSAL